MPGLCYGWSLNTGVPGKECMREERGWGAGSAWPLAQVFGQVRPPSCACAHSLYRSGGDTRPWGLQPREGTPSTAADGPSFHSGLSPPTEAPRHLCSCPQCLQHATSVGITDLYQT